MCVLVIDDEPLIDDGASGPWGAAAPLPEEDGMMVVTQQTQV